MKLTGEQYGDFKFNKKIERETLIAAAERFSLPLERKMASQFMWENGRVVWNLEEVKIIKVDKARRSKDLIVTIMTDSLEPKMESDLFIDKEGFSKINSGGCVLERFFI